MNKGFFFLIVMCIIYAGFSMPPCDLIAVRGGYQVKIKMPKVQIITVKVARKVSGGKRVEELYHKITLPGFANTINKGKPALLKSAFKLAVEDEIPSVEISDIIEEKISLAHKIFPSQGPEWYCVPISESPFYINENHYNSGGEISPYVSLSSPFFIRGQKGVSVVFNPVKYNPRENILTVAKSFTVTFTMQKPQTVKSLGSGLYDTYLRRVFRNLQGALGAAVRSSEFREKEDYLILSADRYIDNKDLQRFIEYRKQLYNVELIPFSETGVSKEETREFIKQKMPTFLLFVGDHMDFPYFLGPELAFIYWVQTYLDYTTVVGDDFNPDISLGLFFVRSEQSLKNIVDKTIYTEAHLDEMGNGYLCWAANNIPNGPMPADHIETLFNELEQDYLIRGGFDVKKVYTLNSPQGSAPEAFEYFNQGIRFFNYNGHGFETGWSGSRQEWSIASAPGQATNTIFPFVLSMACLTGNFPHNTGCWAEHWIGHEKLASAFIAASQPSSINQHAMNRGFGIVLADKEITKLGLMHDFSKEYTFDSIGTLANNLAIVGATEYHLFGDPALETMSLVNTPIEVKTAVLLGEPGIHAVTPRTIHIIIPMQGEYDISVYTVNGRQMYTKKAAFSAGIHILVWDGFRFGRQLFLAVIRGRDREYTEKVITLKY